jgi:hypothetical protein
MISRSLILLSAALLTAPLAFAAADGEGPGIRPDAPRHAEKELPDLGAAPEVAKKVEGGGPFAHFDADGSGGVSQAEFMKAVRDHAMKKDGGERKPEGDGERKPGDRPRPEGGGEGVQTERAQIALAHAAKVFQTSDVNKDASLSSEEFRSAFIALMPKREPK